MKSGNKAFLSIILPIYNVEKYLNKCIDSILEQEFKDFELILVDDGSTDGSGNICEEYILKDERIKVIHKKNGGLSDARNAGMDIANGKYVFFIDSDDFLLTNSLVKIVDKIKENPADVYTFASYDYYSENGQMELVSNINDSYCNNSVELYEKMIDKIGYFIWAVWRYIYSLEIIKENNLRFDVTVKITEDSEFTNEIINLTDKIYACDVPVVVYRKTREDSLMNRITKEKVMDEIRNAKKHYNKYKSIKNINTSRICGYLIEYYFLNKTRLFKNFKVTKEERKKCRIKNDRFIIKKRIHNVKNNIENYITGKYKSFGNKVSLWKEERALIKYLRNKTLKDKYLLLTIPGHTNIGDHAITIAEEEFLKHNKIEVFTVLNLSIQEITSRLKKYISKSVTLLVTGGGFFGNHWLYEYDTIRETIKSFPHNKVIIFPQTIYFNPEFDERYLEEAKKICNKHKNLIICTREKMSYDFSKSTFKNAKTILVPDMVLYLNKEKDIKRNGALLCLRDDAEKNVTNKEEKLLKKCIEKHYETIRNTDTAGRKNISAAKRKKILKKKLDEFRKSEIVVTDRLHGMIFATITGTPCIALGNYNYKIKGVYEWIKDLDYIRFVENFDYLEKNIMELKRLKESKYNFEKEKYSNLLNALRGESINE